MSLEERLRKELTAAIKAKDLRSANIIRMVSTKVMERRTAKGFSGEVDDALYEDVISAYRKSLAKAVDQYKQAGERGAEQAAELEHEIEFLGRYLPQGLSEAELEAAVKAAIDAVGATDVKMIGRIIGQVMKDHKGKVDAADVKRVASQLLS